MYAWQEECLTAWMENGCRGIVNVATGAGKTVLALHAIQALRARHPDLMVKVVVPTVPLAQQWMNLLQREAASEAWRPGFFGGGRHDDPERRALVYIINTAREALPGHMRRCFALNRPVLLIVDECHHAMSPQNRRMFRFVDEHARSEGLYMSLGLSATPFDGLSDEALTRDLGAEVYRYDVRRAVREGVLTPFVVCNVAASFDAEEGAAYAELSARMVRMRQALLAAHPHLKELSGEAYFRTVQALARGADMDSDDPAAAYIRLALARKRISTLASARLQCAALLLNALQQEHRVIIFAERIEQAEALKARLLRDDARPCGIYHTDLTPQARQRNMEAFRAGEVRVLIACRALDEGIDVPDANIGIVLSGASVSRQRIQRLGRILRRAPGKDAACLYHVYIRESAEDSAFLPELEGESSFSLRLYPGEDAFSNELYEYVAADLLKRAAVRGLKEDQIKELRACLIEGLPRADWRLSEEDLLARLARAKGTHARNYAKTMLRVRAAFAAPDEPD